MTEFRDPTFPPHLGDVNTPPSRDDRPPWSLPEAELGPMTDFAKASFFSTIAFACLALALLAGGAIALGNVPALVCAIAASGLAYTAQLLFTNVPALPTLGAWGLLAQCVSCAFFVAGLAAIALGS